VKVIVNSRNFGLFRSTFNALRYATGDATLVMLPVDLQDPPDLLPEFVRLWRQGYEVVAGVRTGRPESILMRGARHTFYRIVNRLSGFEIPEDVGEFQLIDRKVREAVLKFDDHLSLHSWNHSRLWLPADSGTLPVAKTPPRLSQNWNLRVDRSSSQRHLLVHQRADEILHVSGLWISGGLPPVFGDRDHNLSHHVDRCPARDYIAGSRRLFPVRNSVALYWIAR
jgi:Glycosyl transferase family 2